MEKNNNAKQSSDVWVDERMATLGSPGEWKPDVQNGLARLRGRTERARGRGGKFRWIAAVAATVCGLVLALPVPRAHAQRICRDCLVQIESEGMSLDQVMYVVHAHLLAFHEHMAALVGIDTQRKAPDFALVDAAGKTVRLSEFRGKVVLLDFWATWCRGCKEEIPWFAEFQRTYGSDLVVLGISFDDDGWKSVKPFMEANKMNYRVVIGNDEVAKLYGGVDALPVAMVIDRTGHIAVKILGTGTKDQFKNQIEKVLARSTT